MVRWTRVLAFFTGALVFAAGLQFWAMYRQLNEMTATRIGGDQSANEQMAVMKAQADAMRGQVDAMRTASAQTERAIAATNRLAVESRRLADAAIASSATNKKIASAATEANAINRQSLIGVQRAFVVANKPVFEVATTLGAKTDVWVENVFFQNNGNTPTRNLRIYSGCRAAPFRSTVIDPETIKSIPRSVLLDNPITSKIDTIGPHQTRMGSSCFLWQKKEGPLFGNLPVLYSTVVFGRAEYRDAFDGSSAHLTEFCYNTPTPMMTVTQGDASSLAGETTLCEGYNCTDGECDKAARERAARDVAQP